jgi:hypothetical protein
VKNSDILYIEYKGKDGFAFGTLLFRLIDKEKFDVYIIEYSLDTLSIYIKPKFKSDMLLFRKTLEEALESKLTKEWRVYPINSRPSLGNLIILPREVISSPWSF